MPVLDHFPLRLARTRNLHPRFTGAHSPPTVLTPYHRDTNWNFLHDNSEEMAALFDAFSDVMMQMQPFRNDFL